MWFVKILSALSALMLALTFLLAGCAGETETPIPVATPNLEATVQAAVATALPTATPTPAPDIDATVTAGISATQAAAPTQTPTPPPTPDIDATVAAGMAATIAAMPPPTNTPIPTAISTPTPVPTATPRPTATPTPTPIPTATPRPTATPTPTISPAVLLSEMLKQVRPAVVRIEAGPGTGSGAIFETQGRTGYVITNHHVVEGYGQVSVTVNDTTTYQGTVLGVDRFRDLAVVSICCGSFHSLTFGRASSLDPGDEVVAIGYALGMQGPATITKGIVSAVRYDSRHEAWVIQTDASINPGNSGGPMLSPNGEVVGINTFKISETSVEGVGFAISETTVQERIPALKAGAPSPTPTPTRRPTPTPAPSYEGGFGPTSGELWHDLTDGYVETEDADVFLTDAIISATFVNPYSSTTHSWDYGFILRDELGVGGPVVFIVVSSHGAWELYWREEDYNHESQSISSGRLKTFETHDGGSNRLWVVAVGERGYLFVNGEFIAALDLSAVIGAGDVSVVTGAYTGNERAGAVTRYEDFAVTALNKRYGPADGRLVKEPGSIGIHRSGVWTRDFVAEAQFITPSGTDWDYGFIIRHPEYGRLEVIGLTGDSRWFHKTRDVGDSEYTEVQSGFLSAAGANLLGKNHLLVAAFDDWGLFFVNGVYVAGLDLSHNQDYGDVSAIGDFYLSHRGSPEFENFNVWVP